MTWSAKANDFEDPPVGVHLARCIGVIDLGTQKDDYQGKTNIRRKTVIKWELPETLMGEGDHAGKPFVIAKFYTASLGDKASLRRDLVNWRGREFTADELAGFDEKNLLDKGCLLALTEKDGKVRATGIMSKPATMVLPPRVNPLVYLSLEKDRFDPQVYESLSDWFKDTIRKSPEWAELNGKPMSHTTVDDFDDIPF